MVDAFAIMRANREGYELFTMKKEGEKDDCWFRKDGKEHGPFKNLDEAAYAAIYHAQEEQLKRFWAEKDEDG